MATDQTIATNAHVDTVPNEDDTKWSELVAPAPMGIAVLSQLMICTSQMTLDFPIIQPNAENQSINQTQVSLIKHPNSFRTTMVQIVNEAYNAFMRAHSNMEKIQLQVAQVPDYVKDCVKIMKSDNKVAIEKFVPRRLENIEKIADNGEKLSKEVCDAFDLLGQLIQQVLEAVSDSRNAKENDITAAIQKTIDDKKKHQEEAIIKQKQILEREEEEARKLLNKGQQYVMEEHSRSRGILELIFFPGEKERTIGKFERTVEDAKERLEKAKKETMEATEKMQKICDECTESIANMQINVEKDISTDQMIKILIEGTALLSKLQSHWNGMTLYFRRINTQIGIMRTQQNLFVEDAKDAQKNSSLINFMADSIMKSLESSIKSHRTAATYVLVSNNYIMSPLRNMHGMLAIEPAKMQKAHEELRELCKRASEGIQFMFNEDRAQTIREMENALQSSHPNQSIQN